MSDFLALLDRYTYIKRKNALLMMKHFFFLVKFAQEEIS
jgi:hypothetical protein